MPRLPDVPCVVCGELMSRRATSTTPEKMAHMACRTSRANAGPKPTMCVFCGCSFESTRVRRKWTQCCSRACARRLELRQSSHSFQVKPRYGYWTEGGDNAREKVRGELSRRRRRARMGAVESEPYTTAEIAERDGYRCHICGKKVRMDAAYPDARSPSVDHVWPLSLGGDDLRTNVRLACLGCNVARGNRVVGGQQLLFG